MVSNYLSSVRKQFEYYKSLGEKTFAQLSDENLFSQFIEDSNSVAIIVGHLHGNMISRWTNFLTSDGEKETRKRDQEFEPIIKTREELMEKWEAGWACLFNALESITADNFETVIYIRNQGHSITEAINRQMMHYAYHIGQIVFIGKIHAQANWQSLSIPKGESKIYNKAKFEKDKSMQHFTDEFLDSKNG